jgi:hypothetical protein
MLPALFLIEFEGYWESEPGNAGTAYLNPTQVTHVRPYKRDDVGAIEWFALYIVGEDEPFITYKTNLNLQTKVDAIHADN